MVLLRAIRRTAYLLVYQRIVYNTSFVYCYTSYALCLTSYACSFAN